jgi:hypothetical protein
MDGAAAAAAATHGASEKALGESHVLLFNDLVCAYTHTHTRALQEAIF